MNSNRKHSSWPANILKMVIYFCCQLNDWSNYCFQKFNLLNMLSKTVTDFWPQNGAIFHQKACFENLSAGVFYETRFFHLHPWSKHLWSLLPSFRGANQKFRFSHLRLWIGFGVQRTQYSEFWWAKEGILSRSTRLLTRCPCTMTPLPSLPLGARRRRRQPAWQQLTVARRSPQRALSTGHDTHTHTNGQVQAKATIRNHTPINKSLHAYLPLN